MKIKIKLSELLVLMTLAMFSVAIFGTAYAAEHGAYATLLFGVGALNEVTVYQYDASKGAMTAAGLALTVIEFNDTDGNELWENATVGGDSQDETHPIVYVDNTGTTNAAINISASDDVSNQDACLLARYIYNQSVAGVFANTGDPATIGAGLNTTEEQLDASFTPAEENWGVWLYGNYSSCTAGEDEVTFYINATFA